MGRLKAARRFASQETSCLRQVISGAKTPWEASMTAAVRPRPRTRAITSIAFVICYSLFVLSPALAQHEVRGKVLDPERRPLANADVIVTGPAAPIQLRSAADGSFTVPALGSGRYYISAHASGLIADAVPIGEVKEIELVLRLSAINETLVVSAAQIDQPLSRTPDSVTVISGAELEAKQQYTLAAALRSVPGLTLQQSGGPGTLTSLFTRGGESDYTLVLVDGVRVNAFGGGLDLSQVPLQDVERVEVLRGSQSALYGADAIGGVIQIITRSGGSPIAQAHVETGSRDMRRV